MSQPTEPQITYVRSLQRRLHLPDPLLDDHCLRRFNARFAHLDRQQVSDLLDEMIGWETLPAAMQRALGQLDLFEGMMT